jgi:hypothetical protein
MILVAGGDSFIFGNELTDWQLNKSTPSKFTFPALIADYLRLDYSCCAIPGNANDAIARMTIDRCEMLLNEGKQVAVIVAWTFPERFEFPFEFEINSPISPWSSITVNDLINKPETRSFAREFYKNINSGWFAEYNTVKNIIMLEQYLKSKNINYVFTVADNILLKNRNDQALKPYWDLIDFDSWFLFPAATEPHNTVTPRGFYQWAQENKYPVGPDQHPLEQAHQIAATLIQEKFNEMVKKSVQ